MHELYYTNMQWTNGPILHYFKVMVVCLFKRMVVKNYTEMHIFVEKERDRERERERKKEVLPGWPRWCPIFSDSIVGNPT